MVVFWAFGGRGGWRCDGADLAEANLRYHPLEAGVLDAARNGTAEINANPRPFKWSADRVLAAVTRGEQAF